MCGLLQGLKSRYSWSCERESLPHILHPSSPPLTFPARFAYRAQFVWNAPPLCFALAPSLEWCWPLWRFACCLSTALLLGGGLYLTCIHRPPAQAASAPSAAPDGGGVSFFGALLSSPAGISLLAVSLLPGLFATAVAPLVGGVARLTALAVLPCLGASLAIKLTNFPERWLTADLSFSPLHSHCLWHLGVWATQMLYYSYFSEQLAVRGTVALALAIAS